MTPEVLLRRTTCASLLSAFLAAASVTACERPRADAATPLPVSLAEFQQLRWLTGSWRGSGGGAAAFFESYRWVDDSTVQKYDFADSTLAVPSDSGTITLRDGVVRTGSPERTWIVVALDSARVQFAPERNAVNSFEWRRGGSAAWTARLTWDSAGIPKERIYEMSAHTSPPAAR